MNKKRKIETICNECNRVCEGGFIFYLEKTFCEYCYDQFIFQYKSKKNKDQHDLSNMGAK